MHISLHSSLQIQIKFGMLFKPLCLFKLTIVLHHVTCAKEIIYDFMKLTHTHTHTPEMLAYIKIFQSFFFQIWYA